MEKKTRVWVVGGDGFCGWPISLHFAAHGYDVTLLDNLSRRAVDEALGTHSLTPIASMYERIQTWNQLRDPREGELSFVYTDVAVEYDAIVSLLMREKPSTVVHLAEQRSAPYSMKNSRTKRYTVDNNLRATHNLLVACQESQVDPHFIHIGTMGVYGYDGDVGCIPEGYVRVHWNGVEKEILYPPSPGSVYHTTKTMDALLFQFYHKNYQMRITDLHQGIVWGTETDETQRHPKLINRFDYDGDYGTVLNRFIVQSAIHHPLTVYGTGGQTRAFIHIQDTVRCLLAAARNPPSGDKVCIMNQVSETHTVKTLAALFENVFLNRVECLDNPRNEKSDNTLSVCHDRLDHLKATPSIVLDVDRLTAMRSFVLQYKDRLRLDTILPSSQWC